MLSKTFHLEVSNLFRNAYTQENVYKFITWSKMHKCMQTHVNTLGCCKICCTVCFWYLLCKHSKLPQLSTHNASHFQIKYKLLQPSHLTRQRRKHQRAQLMWYTASSSPTLPVRCGKHCIFVCVSCVLGCMHTQCFRHLSQQGILDNWFQSLLLAVEILFAILISFPFSLCLWTAHTLHPLFSADDNNNNAYLCHNKWLSHAAFVYSFVTVSQLLSPVL